MTLDNLHTLSGPQVPHVESVEAERSGGSSDMSSCNSALCRDPASENDLGRETEGRQEVPLLSCEREDLPLRNGLVMILPLSFQVSGRFTVGLIVL